MRNHLVFLTWSGSITKWSHLHRVGGICSWSASDLQVQEANHPRNSGMEMSSNQKRRSGHALINDGKFKGKERRWAHWLKNLSKKNGKATVLGSSINSIHASFSCVCSISLPWQWCGFQDHSVGWTWVQWEPWSQHLLSPSERHCSSFPRQ